MNLHLEYKFNRIYKSDICIVFLHGWGMNKEIFDSIIAKMENPCDILTLDFFGFGMSSEPKKYFDTYEYAYHIFVLLKKLNIKKIILVGHSFGGRISLLLSSLFDVDIYAQILTSSAGINTLSIKKKINIFRYKFCKTLVKRRLLNPKYLDKFGSSDYKKCNANLRSVFVKVVNEDLKKYLKKISAQTILVWDKKDDTTPYKIAKILHKNILNSNMVLFQNGGHFTFLYNIDKFSKIINGISNCQKDLVL